MEPTKIHFDLCILLLKEEDVWVAQCINYDIAAQGSSIDEAKAAFEQTFLGQVILDLHSGKEPLAGVRAAPKFYADLFERAERLGDPFPMHLDNKRPSRIPSDVQAAIPPAFMIDALAQDMRIYC